MRTYLVFFETTDDSYNGGQEMVEARTKDEAIEVFREYYPTDDYKITGLFKQVQIKEA